MGASNDAPPPLLKGWFIKINKLNMMTTNKWIYRRPTGDINRWRKQLKHTEHKCYTFSGSKTHLAEAPVLQLDTWNCKEKKKVWILRKHVKTTFVNSCAGTLLLGLALKKQSEEASNKPSESLHPTANPNKPSAICSWLCSLCSVAENDQEKRRRRRRQPKHSKLQMHLIKSGG